MDRGSSAPMKCARIGMGLFGAMLVLRIILETAIERARSVHFLGRMARRDDAA